MNNNLDSGAGWFIGIFLFIIIILISIVAYNSTEGFTKYDSTPDCNSGVEKQCWIEGSNPFAATRRTVVIINMISII